jgi:hypothetical protein
LGGGSARRKASTYTGQHNTEKRGHTAMPRAGFEPTIPVFERLKPVRALDYAVIVTGIITIIIIIVVIVIIIIIIIINSTRQSSY